MTSYTISFHKISIHLQFLLRAMQLPLKSLNLEDDFSLLQTPLTADTEYNVLKKSVAIVMTIQKDDLLL